MEQKKLTPTRAAAPAQPMNRAQRRAAARRKRRRRQVAIALTAAILCGFAIKGIASSRAENDAQAVELEAQAMGAPAEAAEIVPMVTVKEPTYDFSNLLDGMVCLPLEDQQIIFEACHEDVKLFCTVMAIAKQESNFDPEALGDYGYSAGLMQVNRLYHEDRMERLGITNIFDIQQNVEVALDYINDIAAELAPGDDYYAYGTEALFMAYNMGIQGYMNASANGTTSTTYSAACRENFSAYMAYMMTEAYTE